MKVSDDIPDHNHSSGVNLDTEVLPTTKALGMPWDPGDDKFPFDYSSLNDEFKFTKRNILNKTASLFGLLGLIVPFVVKVLPATNLSGSLDWDDGLPGKTNGRTCLQNCTVFEISRYHGA